MSYENEQEYAEKLANIILKQKNVTVKSGFQNIAYCKLKTKEIFFNFNKIFGTKGNVFKQMMIFNGLAFHEMMHLKHTNRVKNLPTTNSYFAETMMMLEDGRIETLGVMAHEKMADFFNYAVNNVLLENKDSIKKVEMALSMYILCYGRSIYFQDLDFLAFLRKTLIENFGKEMIEKVEGLVDKYIISITSKERVAIAFELYQLLMNKNVNHNIMKGIYLENVIAKGSEAKGTSMDMQVLAKDMPKLDKVRNDIKEDLKDRTKDAKSKDRKTEFETQKQEKLSELQKKKDEILSRMYDNNPKTDDERKKLSDMNDKINEERCNLNESNMNSGVGDDKIDDALKNIKKEQEKLVEKHEEQLKNTIRSIGHELDNVYSDSSFNETEEMINTAKDIENGMRKLSNELVKGYVPNNKSGKVNVRAFINRKSQTDFRVFSKFQPDKTKETKMLVNIFLDGSGSMKYSFQRALNSCWILNEAMNKDKNKVMIYEFSSGFRVAKEYDKPFSVPNLLGGYTFPHYAINDAIPKIESYKRKNGYTFVVDIVITDGCFNNTNDDCILRLNKLGHETILIGVGYSSSVTYGAKHVIFLNTFGELTTSLIRIFTMIKKKLVMKVR